MRYELTIPGDRLGESSHLVEVEAPNWLTALREGMQRLGKPVPPAGKLLCEVRQDGVIAVKDQVSGEKTYIKPVKNTVPEMPLDPPTVSAPPQVQRVMGTMGYLQAQVEERLGVAGQPVAVPMAPAGRTGAHPCLVLPRWEIDRRLEEGLAHQARHGAVPGAASRSDPHVEVLSPSEVENTNVSSVSPVEGRPRKAGTVTALRIDVRALKLLPKVGTGEPAESMHSPLPDGFEWLAAPLEAALLSAPTGILALERALRLLLAATPSRVAGVAVEGKAATPGAKVVAVVGMGQEQLLGRVSQSGGLFATCMGNGLSVVVGRDTEPFTTSQLVPDLGFEPPNATIAAIGDDTASTGVLFVADSLGVAGYRSEDLLVCGHFARVIGRYLETLSQQVA